MEFSVLDFQQLNALPVVKPLLFSGKVKFYPMIRHRHIPTENVETSNTACIH